MRFNGRVVVFFFIVSTHYKQCFIINKWSIKND